MVDNYIIAEILNVKRYLNDMMYLAKDDAKFRKDLFHIQILLTLIFWGCQQGEPCSSRAIILREIDLIMAKNKKFILVPTTDNSYSHVNLPQEYIASQRLQDRANCVTWIEECTFDENAVKTCVWVKK